LQGLAGSASQGITFTGWLSKVRVEELAALVQAMRSKAATKSPLVAVEELMPRKELQPCVSF